MPDQTSDHAARTASGLRSTVEILDAFATGDGRRAQEQLDSCDAGPTLFGMASAWVALAALTGCDTGQLIADMRAQLAEEDPAPATESEEEL